MEYIKELGRFEKNLTSQEIEAKVEQIRSLSIKNRTQDVYSKCFSYIDLTSLNGTDSKSHIEKFTQKAVDFPLQFPDLDNVASICVYPAFVETVGLVIGNSDLAITSVGGGFPASQTYLEVKALECAMAVENGADEVDIVISIGEFLDGEYELVGNEIQILKDEVGEQTLLKVIIESGALAEPNLIRKASLISMLAGADFVKTSTGKVAVSATPEAAVVMCEAIKDFYDATGRMVGFKAAGGVASPEDSALYYTIVEQILGEKWLNARYFRIGASSLANVLLSAIKGETVKYF